jgi:uncharacterized protein RhaS with RHS repeats
MPCCGKGREQLRNQTVPTPAVSRPTQHAVTQAPRRTYFTTVHFEYLGNAPITLVSPATGRRYRFEHKGARVEIDLRDRPWMAAHANLRQLPNS